MSAPQRVLGGAVSTIARPNRSCMQCESLAEHARKTGAPVPLVREVESWARGPLRYFSALCAECADWEWSASWNARHAAARGDPEAQQALERARDARVARGRRFWPGARLAPRRR